MSTANNKTRTIRMRREESGRYTFQLVNGNAYRVYRTNDERGNPDPITWEVYTMDKTGASDQFEGTWDTLADVREYYSLYNMTDEEEAEEEAIEEAKTYRGAELMREMCAKQIANGAAVIEEVPVADGINYGAPNKEEGKPDRVTVTVFGSHPAREYDATEGMEMTVNRTPSMYGRPEGFNASHKRLGYSRTYLTAEEAARNLARDAGITVTRVFTGTLEEALDAKRSDRLAIGRIVNGSARILARRRAGHGDGGYVILCQRIEDGEFIVWRAYFNGLELITYSGQYSTSITEAVKDFENVNRFGSYPV